MSKKTLLISALVLIILLFLVACNRAASTASQATPTGQSPANTPEDSGMSLMAAWGTSTAIAEQTRTAQGFAPMATLTPTPGGPTPMPAVPPTGVATNTLLPGITPVVTVAPLTRPATYTLQSGEHPYCLARRYNVDPDDLLALSGITRAEAYSLPVGTILKIPQTGSYPGTRALHPHPVQYTVAVNDNIYRIACYYGDVDPLAIAANNGLIAPYALSTGRVLNIP